MIYYTSQTNFYGNTSPKELISEFGSPLYVYNEKILRQRCKEMASFIKYPNLVVHYSTKANSNLELLKIIRSEGLRADALSPGEIYLLLAAGFKSDEILYVCNNVSEEEMKYAVEHGVMTSIDSISQLHMHGRVNPGGRVAIRLNTGIGAGHHEKVITGGRKTKFGISLDKISEIKSALNLYNLKLAGITQHIGSLFMEGEPYIEGVKALLQVAKQFDDLEFIDFGGGFGVPYKKQSGANRLDLDFLGQRLSDILSSFAKEYNPDTTFIIEPGRYIVAECGVLLGTTHALKENGSISYVGTDIGFNVISRPILYDSYHDIEVYPQKEPSKDLGKPVTIVGNICESGDILAKDRYLPPISEGDIIGLMDAGAYGYSLSSNYNNRLRPAEVLITKEGYPVLIRKRDSLEDLVKHFKMNISYNH